MNKRERERFDEALDKGNEPGDCPVCDGGDGEPCSEACERAMQFPKTCGCGVQHTRSAWPRLPYVGVMGDDVEVIELRNCGCGSTLAIPVNVDAVLATFLGGEVLS